MRLRLFIFDVVLHDALRRALLWSERNDVDKSSQRPLCAAAHPPEGHSVVDVLFSCSPLHTRVGKQSSSSFLVDECGPVGQAETAQRYSCAGCEENTVHLSAPRCASALHELLPIDQDDVEDLLDILQHYRQRCTDHLLRDRDVLLRIEQDDFEDLLDILQNCNCFATGAGMHSKRFMDQMRKEQNRAEQHNAPRTACRMPCQIFFS